MKTHWSRRLVSVALVVGCCLFVGCGQSYDEWVASFGPDASPGFPCGPPGGGLPFKVPPPPHFVDWSPDGTRIIFDDATLVQLVDIDGTRLQRLADSNPGYPTVSAYAHYVTEHAEFSPDGRQIVYASCEYPTKGLTVRATRPGRRAGNTTGRLRRWVSTGRQDNGLRPTDGAITCPAGRPTAAASPSYRPIASTTRRDFSYERSRPRRRMQSPSPF